MRNNEKQTVCDTLRKEITEEYTERRHIIKYYMDCLDYSKTTDFGSLYSNLGSIKLYGTGINVVMDDEQGGNTILDLGKKKKKTYKQVL